MGLLDTLAGQVAGQLLGGQRAQPAANPLMSAVLGLLSQGGGAQAQPGGGLAGLVQQFQQAGAGELIASWIGRGQNLPVAPEQLRDILGSDTVGQIARQIGTDPQQASSQLAELLPQIIDALTPDGQLPAKGLGNAEQMLGMLGGLLGGRR
jgi:uncharacterized protein YidB (DUF937 family)